jgi:hypothetical protein
MVISFICSPLSTGSKETGQQPVDVVAIKSHCPSWNDPRFVHVEQISVLPEMGAKKAGLPKSRDISATRLSHGDPIGFPPHPRGWFSIIVYHHLIYTAFRYVKPVGINVRLSRRYNWVVMGHLLFRILNTKKPGLRIVLRYFGDPAVSMRPLGFLSYPRG